MSGHEVTRPRSRCVSAPHNPRSTCVPLWIWPLRCRYCCWRGDTAWMGSKGSWCVYWTGLAVIRAMRGLRTTRLRMISIQVVLVRATAP
jgi:hypothetical protein